MSHLVVLSRLPFLIRIASGELCLIVKSDIVPKVKLMESLCFNLKKIWRLAALRTRVVTFVNTNTMNSLYALQKNQNREKFVVHSAVNENCKVLDSRKMENRKSNLG